LCTNFLITLRLFLNHTDSSAENEKLRSLAVLGILEKNQHAFRSKSLIATKEPNGSLIGLDNSSTTDDIFLKSSPSKEVRMQASSVSKRRYGVSWQVVILHC